MAQCTNSNFGLNPLAKEFVPSPYASTQSLGQSASLTSEAALASPTGPDAFEQLPDEARHRAEPCAPDAASRPSTSSLYSVHLVQILAGILEGSISTAGDVVRLAGVCRSFQRVLRCAPLRVQLPRAPGHPVALSRTRKAIACLQSRAPGAVCDLAVQRHGVIPPSALRCQTPSGNLCSSMTPGVSLLGVRRWSDIHTSLLQGWWSSALRGCHWRTLTWQCCCMPSPACASWTSRAARSCPQQPPTSCCMAAVWRLPTLRQDPSRS